MNLNFEPLKPEQSEELCDFFDRLDTTHAPEWAGCYCAFYHTDCSPEAWKQRTPQVNRMTSEALIKTGRLRGYLAKDGDRLIRWVNLNRLDTYPRLTQLIPEELVGQEVSAIVCFMIDPDYRGQGLAGQLLDAALVFEVKRKTKRILAFPFESDTPEKAYHGHRSMYQTRGFKEIAEGVLSKELQ